MKSIMQPLYNFVRFCNLCIAITINSFLPISRWYLELVGLFKYLVWCHIFGKCQNLGRNNEKYYAGTIQFCKIHMSYFEKCQNLGSNDQLLNNFVNFAICALQLP